MSESKPRMMKPFLGHPQAHKMGYAKTHKTVDSSWEELKDFFDAFANADKASGKYQELAEFHKANVTHAVTTSIVMENSVRMNTLVQLIDTIVIRSLRKIIVITSIQLTTTVTMEDTVEDVVEDKAVKNTIVPMQPMAMATMTVVAEGMATTTKRIVITMIAIMLTTANVIVPQVVLARNLAAQIAQVFHTVQAVKTRHPLNIIIWIMKTILTISMLMRKTTARCQQICISQGVS